jgi:RNA polymerase sigma-70 factor, ECF subfamily
VTLNSVKSHSCCSVHESRETLQATAEPRASSFRDGLSLIVKSLLDESDLVDALQRRDEAAFVQLVRSYQGRLLRLALVYVPIRAVAEEIVQEAWLGVLQGIDRFERRSSLKTWLFRIVVNRARTRGQRERRVVPFSALASSECDEDEAAVPEERFLGPDHPEWPGHWAVPPNAWPESPESELLTREALDLVQRAIDGLPPAQREVITLRDVEGASSEEVCNILGITETNQRVLLHRARSRVRAALEGYFNNKQADG